jgi:transcription elongation factor Elf1
MNRRWATKPRRTVTVQCEHCGRELAIYPYHPRRTCSPACRTALREAATRVREEQQAQRRAASRQPRHPPDQRVCPICGELFLVPYKRRERGKVCSSTRCRDLYVAQLNRDRAAAARASIQRETVTCATCGLPFEAFPSVYRKYCGPACTRAVLAARGWKPSPETIAKSQARIRELRADPEWRARLSAKLSAALTKRGREVISCGNCGQSFEAPAYEHRRFCGPACWAQFASRERKGRRYGPKVTAVENALGSGPSPRGVG